MSGRFRLIVADPNYNVRNFLKREFEDDGHKVQTAGNEVDLLTLIDADGPPDLIIFDLDMPSSEGIETLKLLKERVPYVPIVIHTLLSKYRNHPVVLQADAFVEKRGAPTFLKSAMALVLGKYYPERIGEDVGERV